MLKNASLKKPSLRENPFITSYGGGIDFYIPNVLAQIHVLLVDLATSSSIIFGYMICCVKMPIT